MAKNILTYVQIENAIALIDSRVYCRDIIEVEHRFWFNDTLRKYQPLIESRFGIVRFQTSLSGKVGMPEKYALLTEPQCNLLLALSRNIGKVAEKKADLIADFESAKEQIRANLERSLTLSQQDSNTEFKYPIAQVHIWSGYANIDYTERVIRRDYVAGKDYIFIDQKPVLNANAVLILLSVARPKSGTIIVPDDLKGGNFPWDDCQQCHDSKINRRRSQQRIGRLFLRRDDSVTKVKRGGEKQRGASLVVKFKGDGLGTTNKTSPHCFKIGEPFDSFLRSHPNKSNFLRQAVIDKFNKGC